MQDAKNAMLLASCHLILVVSPLTPTAGFSSQAYREEVKSWRQTRLQLAFITQYNTITNRDKKAYYHLKQMLFGDQSCDCCCSYSSWYIYLYLSNCQAQRFVNYLTADLHTPQTHLNRLLHSQSQWLADILLRRENLGIFWFTHSPGKPNTT